MVLELLTAEAADTVDAAAAQVTTSALAMQLAADTAAAAGARVADARAQIPGAVERAHQAAQGQEALNNALAAAANASTEAQEARRQRDDASKTAAAAHARVTEVAGQQQKVAGLQQQAAKGDADVARLQPQIDELRRRLAEWPTDLHGHPLPGKAAVVNELALLTTAQAKARESAADARARIKAFGDLIAAASKAAADVDAADKATAAAQSKVPPAETKEAEATTALAAARERVAQLKASAGIALRAAVEAADTEVARLNAAITDVAQRVAAYHPRLPHLPNWKLPEGAPQAEDDPELGELRALQSSLGEQQVSAAQAATEARGRLATVTGPDAELVDARAVSVNADAAEAVAATALATRESALSTANDELAAATAQLAMVEDILTVLAAGGPEAALSRIRTLLAGWSAALRVAAGGAPYEIFARAARLRELEDADLSAQVVGSLGAAPAIPAVLLPVRLETRFQLNGRGGSDLLVRIYPDDVSVDSHRPELTHDEASWGEHFWANQSGADNRPRDAWAGLVGRFGAARAAWIARETRGASPEPRAGTWTRAARAALLPERWLVLAYRGGDRVAWAVTDRPVRLDLAVGPTPGSSREEGFATDASMRWLVDLEEAFAAGMAVRLADAGPGVDRVVVLGLRPEPANEQLGGLLAAHHFTDGLGLLDDGTATNVMKEAATGLASSDPSAEASWRLEQGAAQSVAGDGTAGDRLARALGVPTAVFASAACASTDGQRASAAMNTALWPTTWGHLLTVRLGLADSTVAPVRDHFIGWVRARGPLPVLRVGSQPYGVLPITALARWMPAPGEEPLGPLADLLCRLGSTWVAAGRVALAADFSSQGLLSRTPRSASFSARGDFFVDDAQWFSHAVSFMGLTHAEIDAALLAEGGLAAAAGASVRRTLPWQARIVRRPDTAEPGWPLADGLPLVDPDGDYAGRSAPAYIGWLASASAADIAADQAPRSRDTLLYLLFRQSCRLGDIRGALTTLADVPADELARLAADTLDLATARYDAWVTSFASRRLDALQAGEPDARPVLVGGYGWVEGPWPVRESETVPAQRLPAGTEPGLLTDRRTSGYVHAPSLPQAVTAAVLRSGYLGRASEASPFAVDLSSRRVRLANDLADGIRDGQPLSMLLGYRLARTLRELRRDDLLVAFQALAPQSGPTGSGTGAATPTADGLSLVRSYLAGTLPFQGGSPPAPWDASATDVANLAMRVLCDAVDAFDDATVADAVHHTLQGNYGRATASLVARSRGEVAPPEFDVVRTPRTGTALTFRILLLTPASSPAGGWNWDRPRVRVEPRLAAWTERLLGPPSDISVAVEARDRTSGDLLALPEALASVSLGVLDLAALDLLALADHPADLDRTVAAYVLAAQRRPVEVPADAVVRVLPDAPAGGRRLSLGDALAMGRAATRLLAVARPLDARDLEPPGTASPTAIDVEELAERAKRAIDEADKTVTALGASLGPRSGSGSVTVVDPAKCRVALAAAWSCGVLGALPEPGGGTTEDLSRLAQTAATAQEELSRRVERAKSLTAVTDDTRTQALTDAIRALFGETFRVLPQFAPNDPALLARAVDATDTTAADGGDGPVAWLGKVASVRAPVAALEAVCSCSEALDTGVPLTVQIGQLPLPDTGLQRWVGLPSAEGGMPGARLSLVLAGSGSKPASTGDAATALAGLLVDEWVEVVPTTRETTGLTFAYDAPGSQAPQAVLVAVPPRADAPTWDVTDLEAALLETADLVAARTVDLADLDRYGAVAPAGSADSARLAVLRAYLPAVSVPTEAGGPSGVDPNRLAHLPPDYGIVVQQTPPIITAVSPTNPFVVQGRSVTVTVAGSSLDGVVWSVSPPAGLTLTPGISTATSASVMVTASADASTAARTLSCSKALGGSASTPLRLEGRARVDGVTPHVVVQEQYHPVPKSLTVTGCQLSGATVARVEGLAGVTATPSASADTILTLALVVPSSPKPFDTGGRDKPIPVTEKYVDVAVRVVLSTATNAARGWLGGELPVVLTVSHLTWVPRT